jgi:hypothetical protein
LKFNKPHLRAAGNKGRIKMKRFGGDQRMERIDEGEQSKSSRSHSKSSKSSRSAAKLKLHNDDDGDKSVASSAIQSSIHLGLGGLGAEDSDAPIDDDSDSENNSIFTETDLAQSKYDMSVRNYEIGYLNRNPSILSKQSKSKRGD